MISYCNNIYLFTTNEFICQSLVKIEKVKNIHLFDKYVFYKNFVNNKNCQENTQYIYIYIYCIKFGFITNFAW
jgi:hypothetical protein